MKRYRTTEVYYYEWRISAWLHSESRDSLDAAGRGIYRELLDHCYAAGSFPDDKAWICRKCACTPEQLEAAWPVIERQFSLKEGLRKHVPADIFRKEYQEYIDKQKYARQKGIDKANGAKQMRNGGSTVVATLVQPKLTKLTNEANENVVVEFPTFDKDRQEAWRWFLSEYPGDLYEEHDCQIFMSVVQTFEDIVALRKNLPLWKVCDNWQKGFIQSAENFLRKRIFRDAPKTRAPTEQQTYDPWASLPPGEREAAERLYEQAMKKAKGEQHV